MIASFLMSKHDSAEVLLFLSLPRLYRHRVLVEANMNLDDVTLGMLVRAKRDAGALR